MLFISEVNSASNTDSTSTNVFRIQPFLSESGGNLQIVPEPHVSCNDNCVAGTAVSGSMR